MNDETGQKQPSSTNFFIHNSSFCISPVSLAGAAESLRTATIANRRHAAGQLA